MIWFRLAFKNIMRLKARSVFSLVGVAFAITVLYGLLEFQKNYESGLRGELNSLGAHVMIVPKGCPYEAATIALHGGKWPRYISEDYLPSVKAIPGVAQAAGIIMDALFDIDKKRNMVFLGIDADYPLLRAGWKVNGSWFGDERSIILGSSVAQEEKKKPGDRYYLKAKGESLYVSGVLARSNTQDDGFYFLPKKTLQRIFGLEGKLVVILIQTSNIEKVGELTLAIREREQDLNVFPLSELLGNVSRVIQTTKVFILAIVLVAVITAMMGVFNTILMAVFERTKEIGMMKAIGASRLDVFKLIWAETTVLGVAGGLAGVGLALVLAKIIEAFLRAVLPYAPAGTLIGFSPGLAGVSAVFSVVMGLVSGLYPAALAASVRPIVAIRTE